MRFFFISNSNKMVDGNPMVCPLCPNCTLDPLGYHCVTCKRGGDITTRHNTLHNVVCSTFQRAGLSAHLEVGCGGGQDNSRTQPADIHVTIWDCGTSAAFDITIGSYGAWEPEALRAFSQMATRLVTPKSKVVAELYGCLSLLLVIANARLINPGLLLSPNTPTRK